MHCFGQRIDDIVGSKLGADGGGSPARAADPQLLSAIHVTTNPEVIARFLLLSRGDAATSCVAPTRSASCARSRSSPMRRCARFGRSGRRHAARRDERRNRARAGCGDRAGHPFVRFLRFGDANLDGEGIYLAGDWRDGGAFRDGFGGRFVDNQMLGRPYTLSVQGFRNPLGTDWVGRGFHPFYTDIQRFAWRVSSERSTTTCSSRTTSTRATRFGWCGTTSTWAASSASGRRDGSVCSARRSRATTSAPANAGAHHQPRVRAGHEHGAVNRYVDHRIARVNVLWGVRDIGFTRVRGLDALTATEDLPVGFQLGTLFGRSLSVLGSRDDDIFMSSDLYVGRGRPQQCAPSPGRGRRASRQSAGVWDGMLANALAIQYLKTTVNNTTTLSLEFSGGWRQRIPFNSLVERSRGWSARILRVEHTRRPAFRRATRTRSFLGRPNGLVDFGVALSPTRDGCGRATFRTA